MFLAMPLSNWNPSAVTLPLGVLVRTQFFLLFVLAFVVALLAMFQRWFLRRKWKPTPLSPLADLEIDSRLVGSSELKWQIFRRHIAVVLAIQPDWWGSPEVRPTQHILFERKP
jgi:hypothetical protein